MKRVLSPRTARHARLLRLVKQVARANNVTQNDGEQLAWVNSHVKRDKDIALSREDEWLRERMLPASVDSHSVSTYGQTSHGNVFQFREHPMFPGEYIPAEHNSMGSLRQQLRADLTAMSIKEAWMRVSGGALHVSIDDYYAGVDGLDAEQVGEVVAATLPDLQPHDARALVTRVLEAVSTPASVPVRQLGLAITAEAVGLDRSRGHYSNFLEWMGGLANTRAFKTEHALFEFCRRRFNRSDVFTMNENYNLMGKSTLQADSADCYSHFYSVLRDYTRKIAGEDTRHQLGVRVDDAEVDRATGVAVGHGRADGDKYAVTALIRENVHGTGEITMLGKPLSVAFDDKAWLLEMVLMPFDEAKLSYRDFDVHLIAEGKTHPSFANEIAAYACRLAVANAISKLLPLTRIALKKAGLLSFDRRKELGQYPGFLDGKKKRRPFSKR